MPKAHAQAYSVGSNGSPLLLPCPPPRSASPCTSYLFTANSVNNSGTCTLQRNPLVGGVAWSPQVAVGCINRATGGEDTESRG